MLFAGFDVSYDVDVWGWQGRSISGGTRDSVQPVLTCTALSRQSMLDELRREET
mgnify:CR=1 FL=1